MSEFRCPLCGHHLTYLKSHPWAEAGLILYYKCTRDNRFYFTTV